MSITLSFSPIFFSLLWDNYIVQQITGPYKIDTYVDRHICHFQTSCFILYNSFIVSLLNFYLMILYETHYHSGCTVKFCIHTNLEICTCIFLMTYNFSNDQNRVIILQFCVVCNNLQEKKRENSKVIDINLKTICIINEESF